MGIHDPLRRCKDAVPVRLEPDVEADGLPGGILHRDSLLGGAPAQCHLLLFGQSQSHGHDVMVPV